MIKTAASIITMALLSFFLLAGSYLNAAPKDERIRIALLDLRAGAAESSLAQFAGARLSEKLYASGKFTLVERSQLELILKEQGLQHTGCADNSCAVQLGRILSVSKILMGSLDRVDSYTLSIKSIDVESGVVDGHFSSRADLGKDLDRAAGEIARKVYERYHGGGPSSAGYYLRGAVPGWSQVYSGHEVKGYSLMGAFVFSGIFMGYSLYDFKNKRAEYEDLGQGTSQSTFDRKYEASEKALTVARVSVGIFAAVYVLHVFDMLLFSRPTVVLGSNPGKIDTGPGMSLHCYYARDNVYPGADDARLMVGLEKRL